MKQLSSHRSGKMWGSSLTHSESRHVSALHPIRTLGAVFVFVASSLTTMTTHHAAEYIPPCSSGVPTEAFRRGKHIAAHVRSSSNRKHTTVREPCRRAASAMPGRRSPSGRQAGTIRRHASALVEIIPGERMHPEQGFRARVGILRLAKRYGRKQLEPPVVGRS